jgi:S1-C subfamily serine protease
MTKPNEPVVYALSNQDLYRRVAPSVVLVSCPGKGYGTGFFYGSDGIVATNHHVLRGVDHAEIVTQNGQRYPVFGIVAEDPAHDLILLSTGIPPPSAGPAGEPCRCRPGDRVIVVSRHKVFTDALAEGTGSPVPSPLMGIRSPRP